MVSRRAPVFLKTDRCRSSQCVIQRTKRSSSIMKLGSISGAMSRRVRTSPNGFDQRYRSCMYSVRESLSSLRSRASESSDSEPSLDDPGICRLLIEQGIRLHVQLRHPSPRTFGRSSMRRAYPEMSSPAYRIDSRRDRRNQRTRSSLSTCIARPSFGTVQTNCSRPAREDARCDGNPGTYAQSGNPSVARRRSRPVCPV